MATLTPDISLPTWIPRGRALAVTLPVWDGAALAVPSSGTFTLSGPDGTELHSQAVVVASSIAGATIPALEATLGEGYLEGWQLVFGGVTFDFLRTAALVRRPLWPVLQDLDLTTLQPALAARLRALGQTTYTAQRLEAWRQIVVRLMRGGRYPYLIMDAGALRTAHLLLTLHWVYDAGGPEYAETAATYWERYEDEWKQLVFTYDEDSDDIPQAEEQQTSQRRPSRSSVDTVSTRSIWRPA